eukprot:CAMPEP_0196775034 /NCGR_PEP_ID=MMETSP1104-20130614/3786_1 /TAXON_ID=33652 /ORGANISM="Cafeteria sp., Strain Caron Lab Isolate" /LENGTH=178 /DNA_ID=CAMNT_0042145197 /DNA_START=20 /DNA_END=553 /DNA_ORIENTATION=-
MPSVSRGRLAAWLLVGLVASQHIVLAAAAVETAREERAEGESGASSADAGGGDASALLEVAHTAGRRLRKRRFLGAALTAVAGAAVGGAAGVAMASASKSSGAGADGAGSGSDAGDEACCQVCPVQFVMDLQLLQLPADAHSTALRNFAAWHAGAHHSRSGGAAGADAQHALPLPDHE